MGILTELAKRAALKTANRVKDIPTQAEQVAGQVVPYAKSPLAQVAAQTPTLTTPRVTPAGLESPARRKFVKQASSLALNSALPGGGVAKHAIKAVASDTPLAPILKNLVEPGEALVSEAGQVLPAMTPKMIKRIHKLFVEGNMGDELYDVGSEKTFKKALKHSLGNFYEPTLIPHLESSMDKLKDVLNFTYHEPFDSKRYQDLRSQNFTTRYGAGLPPEQLEFNGLNSRLKDARSYLEDRLEDLVSRPNPPQEEIRRLEAQWDSIPDQLELPGYVDSGSLMAMRNLHEAIRFPENLSKIDELSDNTPEFLSELRGRIRSAQFTPEELKAIAELENRVPDYFELLDKAKPDFTQAPASDFDSFVNWLGKHQGDPE